MNKTQARNTGRLSREEWLQKALDALVDEGPRVLTIQNICRRLGVSRGSFYWHFTDKDDFILRLAEFWEYMMTSNVAQAVDSVEGSPEDRLLMLMKLVSDTHAASYDVAIRAWASHEPRADEIVRNVDLFRYQFVRSLFAEMGFTGDELEMRARTLYVFTSFDPGVTLKESKRDKEMRRLLRHKFFIKK